MGAVFKIGKHIASGGRANAQFVNHVYNRLKKTLCGLRHLTLTLGVPKEDCKAKSIGHRRKSKCCEMGT